MALLAAVSATLLLAAPSSGATFTVTSTENSGPGTLRQAITDANGNANDPTVDLIQFSVTGNIDLLSELPQIDTSMTIAGPGVNDLAVRRSPAATMASQFRLFAINPAVSVSVTIQGMTISGARASGFQGGAMIKAGAGSLALDSVWITDNQSTGNGGGISVDGGTTTIRNTTLSGNVAGFGGGVGVTNAADADLINTTISGNSSTAFGGGIYIGSTSHITVNSSTIAGNKADSDDAGGGSGGGSYNASGGTAPTFRVANDIYANNTVGASGGTTQTQCGGGDHSSSGYNLRTVADSACTGFADSTDSVNASPMLGTLGVNGTGPPTIALLTGSPAIEAGNPDSPVDDLFPACPTADERGISRLGPNRCDIGAFERRSSTSTTLDCSPSTLTLGAGSSTCTATVTDLAGVESPTGGVSFETDATGTFSDGGGCTLTMTGAATAGCSISYTPDAVGTGSHLISAFYEGTADLTPSDGSHQIAVAGPPQPVTPVTPAPAFDLAGAIKRCKKKFPKGKKRKKCIKRAKARARGT
jgi:hypothetical protein